MNGYSKMMQVHDNEVSNIFVKNIMTMELGQGNDSIIELVKEPEETINIALTMDEWNSLNCVAWHVYELLNNRQENTKSLLEKSAIEKFMDKYESVIQKLNDVNF